MKDLTERDETMKSGLIASAILLMHLTACCAKAPLADKCGAGSGGEGAIPLAGAPSPLSDINFAFDSSKLDATSQAILKQNADWLAQHGNAKVTIEGHCDTRGTNEYNLALGERRARSAFDYLRSLGVTPERMNTISYGEENNLVPGAANEVDHAKNRRDHFAVK